MNLWQEFAKWMIPMAWQVALLVGVLWLTTRFCLRNKSARLRYALWMLVPIRLMLPPTLVIATGWGYWLLPSENSATPKATIVSQGIEISTNQSEERIVRLPLIKQTTVENNQANWNAPPEAITSAVSFHEPIQDPHPNRANGSETKTVLTDWPQVGIRFVLTLYACVSIILLLRLARGIQLGRRLRFESTKASFELEDLVNSCRRQMNVRAAVRVACGRSDRSPMLVGIFRPMIVLPQGIEKTLNYEELTAIVIHELHHLRRRDPIVHLVERWLLCIYWFHPAVWFAFQQSRSSRELACDEATIATMSGKRTEYGMGMIKIAEMVFSPCPALSIPFVGAKSQLAQRIHRILDLKTPIASKFTWRSMLFVVAVGLLLIPSAARNAAISNGDANSIAETAEPSPLQEPPEKYFATISEVRVKVVDVNGKPIPKVHLLANTAIGDGQGSDKWNNEYDTDGNGEATLRIAPKTMSLRLWATRDDLVGLFISWEDEGSIRRKEQKISQLPKEIKLTMEKGTTIGGVVVDSKGNPIANTKIQVQLNSGGAKADGNDNSSLNNWLANGSDAAITSDTGRWQISNVPLGDDLDLELTVENPDYLSETSSRSLAKFGLTLAQLRDGSAQIMQKLVAGTGEIEAMEFHHIKLNPDGSFLVNGLRPGSYRLLFQVYEPPTGCLVDPVGIKYMEFKTTDYKLNNNELDLGVIDIKINPLPKVGEPLPNFRWMDEDGKAMSLDKVKGQFVFFDFWATWCGPCLAFLPEIDRLQSGRNSPKSGIQKSEPRQSQASSPSHEMRKHHSALRTRCRDPFTTRSTALRSISQTNAISLN